MELKDTQLIELDKEAYELNKIYGLVLYSLNSVPNVSAVREIITKINELKSKLKKIKTNDSFEKIIIKNHLLNLENQRVYLQYGSTQDKEGVEDIVKIFFGEESIKEIKTIIEEFDYDADWDYYLSYQEFSYRAYPSDSPELQERFKDTLRELKKDIFAYAQKYYGLEKKYDFELILGQPYSQQSHFTPSTRRIEIAPSTFFAYKEGNEININVTATIQTIFHEFIGHALQEFNSRNLPLGIQDNSINTSVPTMSLHAEGFAQMADASSIDFMKENKDKYNIKDEYIKQRKLNNIRREIGVFWNFYQYLKLKSLENSKFDYKKEFMDSAKNFGALMNYEHSNQAPFSFFKNVSYIFGLRKIKKIYDNLIVKYGEKNKALINRALSTGLLNIDVLEEFVNLYIQNNLK